MKPAAFDYERPSTVEHAVELLAASDGEARLLAGGQSLVPMMNLRLAYPSALIDIAGIADLSAIEDRGSSVAIGTGVTHARIEDGEAGDHWGGLLAHVAREIAYRGVRNRGTIGGSLAHADPAADWPVALAALGASVEIAGPLGLRSVDVHEFVTGMFETVLDPGEMIAAVVVPKLPRAARWSFIKVRRKRGAFADALAAVIADPDAGTLRIAAGGVATGFRRLTQLEDSALASLSPMELATRMETTIDEIDPDMDVFHRRLHVVSLARAVQEVSA